MSYAPTLTGNDVGEKPSVHIEFTSLDPDTESVTVYRIFGGITTTVRTARNKAASGAFSTDDTEAPEGVEVVYRAQQFDAAGNELGYTDSSSITLPYDSMDEAWLSNPLDPTSGVRVTMTATAGTAPARPFSGTRYAVGLRTFVLTSQRQKLQDLDMGFFTDTVSDRDTIDAMVTASNGLLLIRTPPPMNVPRMLYCWAKNPVPVEFDLISLEDSEWTNVVDEVSEPEGEPITSLIPWQIYIDAFPTWGDMNAAYLTWQDARSNPPEGA